MGRCEYNPLYIVVFPTVLQATVVPSKVHSDNTSTQPSAGLTTTTPVRDRSSSVPVGASNALSAKRQPLERRMTTGSGPPRPVDANGCVKSMGLPSFSSLETSMGQIPRQNGVGSLSSSMQSSSTVNSSFSEPSSPVVQTPPNLRHRRQLSLSPPTASDKRLSGIGLPGYNDSTSPVKQKAWRQVRHDEVICLQAACTHTHSCTHTCTNTHTPTHPPHTHTITLTLTLSLPDCVRECYSSAWHGQRHV